MVDLTDAQDAIRERLGASAADDQETLDFVLFVVRECGLTAELTPSVGTTERQIERRAKEAENWKLTATTDAQWAAAAREARVIRSEAHQRVRGGDIGVALLETRRAGAVIAHGPPERRRPEPEWTHAMQLLDWHLEWTLGLRPMARYRCIAAALKAACGLVVTPDAVKHRIADARPLWHSAYELMRWRSYTDAHPLGPPRPFPYRVPIEPGAGIIVDAGGASTMSKPTPPEGSRSARSANLRSCLRCGRMFRSASAANRLCWRHGDGGAQ